MQQGRKNIVSFFFILVFVFSIILHYRQIVYASQENSIQDSTNLSSNMPLDSPNAKILNNIITATGESLLVIIVSIIGIYKFIVEKKYEIKNIEIFQLNRKPLQNNEFTEFFCKKITKNKINVEQVDFYNPFYLDISLKIYIPSEKKTLDSIVVKKLFIKIKDYELKYIPQKSGKRQINKCYFNKNEKKENCRILMQFPTFENINDKKLMNIIKIFEDPQDIKLHIVWYPKITLLSFFFPQKRTVVFEAIEYEKGISRIGIKSKGVYKG